MCTRTILAKKLFYMYFLLNPGNISHTSSSHNTAIHCIHICALPCQAVAEDITSKCKRFKKKSVMPYNPCLTTHLKENKRVLIYAHNSELITRMKHMRCFHNFEERVKQMLWPAVLPFSCHLAIKDAFTQALFYRIHTYNMNKQG